MRRYLPTLAGASVVAVFIVVAGIGESGGVVGVTPFLLLPLAGLVAWWVSRRGRGVERGWGGVAPFEFVAAGTRAPASPAAVAGALARVESRELLASGSFGVGLGFAALVVLLFGFVFTNDFGGDVPRFVDLLPLFVHPLVGLTVLAAFRGRTRGRRDDVEELFGTCPTTEATRTVGHLGSAGTAVAAALVTAAFLTGGVLSQGSVAFGGFGARQLADVAAVAVLAIGGVALGVALARIAPWVLSPVVAVVAIGFLSARLATNGERATDPVRQLSTWLGDLELDLRFTAPHWFAHLVWLVALTAIVAALAVLRDERRTATLAVLGTAAAVAVASGWAATRPIDADDARHIASLLTDPLGSQRCEVAGAVSVCTFPGDDALRDRYLEAVGAVAAALPASVDPMVLRYAALVERRHLDPEVVELLPAEVDEPGLLPFDMQGVPPAYEAAALWVGLGATGIAADLHPGTPEVLRGQARGVLVLWLATLGADEDTAEALTSFDPGAGPSEPGHRPWPDPCFAGAAPAFWAETDVTAARSLTRLDDDDVLRVVHAHWDELVDPSTSTDDLLGLLGLDPLGPATGTTRVHPC